MLLSLCFLINQSVILEESLHGLFIQIKLIKQQMYNKWQLSLLLLLLLQKRFLSSFQIFLINWLVILFWFKSFVLFLLYIILLHLNTTIFLPDFYPLPTDRLPGLGEGEERPENLRRGQKGAQRQKRRKTQGDSRKRGQRMGRQGLARTRGLL